MIVDAGGRALAVAADVTDPNQLDQAVASIERELGPLTLAANAAGIANAARAEAIPHAQWQKVNSLNPRSDS
jgi:NAD(P)-dependent dehydrogenase (short-subunit alcohol dehydrogenase family)